MITVILGGARSGKSRFAQELANANGEPVVYIATATATDNEMALRIIHHQQNRPQEWRLCEAPLALTETIEHENQHQTLLVDCLTLWLNNHIFHNPTQDFEILFTKLIEASKNSTANIIFVANEVGLGIIPLGEITRQFVDEAGRLNQMIARAADKVVFVAAGLPLMLKDSRKP